MPWEWRPEIVAVLAAFGAAYLTGWWRLRLERRTAIATLPALLAYLAGLALLLVALCSPVAVIEDRLFSYHMVQHELLLTGAPPLLLLGRPLPVALAALPLPLGRPLARALRRLLDGSGTPLRAWWISTAVLWLWHLPAAYDAVQRSQTLHDAEHVLFFLAGLLFWWPIVQAAPYPYRVSRPAQLGYALAGMTQSSVLGALITLSGHVLYPYYAFAGANAALQDQERAGLVMWFFGAVPPLVAVIALIWAEPRQEQLRL